MVLYHEAASIRATTMMKATEATSNAAEAKKKKKKLRWRSIKHISNCHR
jgi:hypothetical protein